MGAFARKCVRSCASQRSSEATEPGGWQGNGRGRKAAGRPAPAVRRPTAVAAGSNR